MPFRSFGTSENINSESTGLSGESGRGGAFRGFAKIEIDRVLGRLDRLLAAKDYSAAEAHLKYWLGEAGAAGDRAARLSLLNELMGFYRRGGDGTAARQFAEAALEEYGSDNEFCGTVFFGTTCLNAATVFKAFGAPERAIGLYERCREIYCAHLEPDDVRFGGLYNNMGLALHELGRFSEAREAFEAAIRVQEDGGAATALDRAITYLNLCDLAVSVDAAGGEGRDSFDVSGTDPGYPVSESTAEEIDRLIEKAYGLIIDPKVPRNPYYAFVCEKCAPVFGFYGYFLYKNELSEAAKALNAQFGAE